MIALVISSAWPKYRASSPFNNLLKATHPEFKVFAKLGHELADPVLQEEINQCEALIVDDVLSQCVGFYKNGPKLMVGGDPHAHRPDQVARLEAEYASVDYVLTGAYPRFCKKPPQYLYPPAKIWEKHVYFPHMVPDDLPEVPAWTARKSRALLSGDLSAAVYPFRAACLQGSRQGWPIDVLGPDTYNHTQYFEHLGRYRMAIACNSIFEYTVAKYFEIPAMGTVLIAPRISEEEQDIIGYRYLMYTLDASTVPSMLATVSAANDDSYFKTRSAVVANFYRKCHSVRARLDYVAKLVAKIKAGGFKPEDALMIFREQRMAHEQL